MWIKEPGEVISNLDFLGTYENCLYLLRGKESMIIGGGMSYIVPSLEAQLSAIAFDPDHLRYLVILHSHFDHCGAVPYLKRKFPHIQVLASAHSERVFSKEKAVNFIADINKQMIDSSGLQSEYDRLNLKFDGIQVDRVITEEDTIDLGDDIEVHFMNMSGHTACSMAAYVPKLKILFPSDAAPTPIDEENVLYCLGPQYDFSLYTESLKKLVSCEPEVCAFEHHGAVTGDQAKKVLCEGLRQTENFKNHVIELYRQTGDLDKIAQTVATETLDKNRFSFMDKELSVTVLKTVIRNVLRNAKLLDEAPAP